MITTHKLKTWPQYYEQLLAGTKNFEIRRNDRDFRTGDMLILQEYYPQKQVYSGREMLRQIKYILEGEDFGIMPGFCILQLNTMQHVTMAIDSLNCAGVHEWFELSYAQYLTIPRSVLQSMPESWQIYFVQLLNELDETIDWRPQSGRYIVRLTDDAGMLVTDPLMDYERGRRKIPHIKK